MIYNDILLVLILAFTFTCACGLINEFYKDYKIRVGTKILKFRNVKVPKTTLINEVILWTKPILLSKSIKKYPRYKIMYRKHKSIRGRYRGATKTIEIYVHPNIKVEQLVKTILHEIQHYIQHLTDPNFAKYELFSKKVGYELNPYEVEARSFAFNQLNACLLHLKKIKYIL